MKLRRMTLWRWTIAIGLALLIAPLAAAQGEGTMGDERRGDGKNPSRDTMSDTWAATDALNRSLPDADACGTPKKNRTVGIFYFLWLDARHDGAGLFDNSKLLAAAPDNPKYGPPGAFHWWGEPYLGYYRMDDPFVIRKHAQMLADAGVDVIILDVTNAITYENVYLALCREYEKIRAEGGKTPQIAFIANANNAATVQKLYDEFYSKNLYHELWFRWKEKPLILSPPDGLSPALMSFFAVRHSWAWHDPKGWFGDGKDKWPWVDNYPQAFGWHESREKPEEISVSVAQHPTSNIGRSFHADKQPPAAECQPAVGLHFAEQWERALKVDPEFVFITGWNEWVAQRFLSGKGGGPGFLGRTLHEGETFFVDQYNEEFSRDIEPMRGGHGDNYYYQMVAGIRRYKGVRPRPKASRPKTIPITGDFAPWKSVAPEYLDDLGDAAQRDHAGWNGAGRYVNATGRNDFDRMKVAQDKTNLYFYVRTATPIDLSAAAKNAMTLLIDADGDRKTGWEGYDFAVMRSGSGEDSTFTLRRNVGGKWEWSPLQDISFVRNGGELHFALPRAALGMTPDKGKLRFDFKWADGLPDVPTALDFIDKGDVAPNGRFNYRYEE